MIGEKIKIESFSKFFFLQSSFSHRRDLCRRLRDELKYHVIALDYRGFGDSTGEPSEKGLVKDVIFLYQWLKSQNPNVKRRIYLWGHSLGSAVATQVAAQLSNEKSSMTFSLFENLFQRSFRFGNRWFNSRSSIFRRSSSDFNALVFFSNETQKCLKISFNFFFSFFVGSRGFTE